MSSGSLKRNITVQIDEALLKSSRHLAVDKNQSLSEWVANLISQAVKKSSGHAASRRRALAVLNSPLKLGGNVLSREDIHER